MLLRKSLIAGNGLNLYRGFCQFSTEGDLTTLNKLIEKWEKAKDKASPAGPE